MEPTIVARFLLYAMEFWYSGCSTKVDAESTRDGLHESRRCGRVRGLSIVRRSGGSNRATSRYSPTKVMHRQLEAGSVAHNLYNFQCHSTSSHVSHHVTCETTKLVSSSLCPAFFERSTHCGLTYKLGGSSYHHQREETPGITADHREASLAPLIL